MLYQNSAFHFDPKKIAVTGIHVTDCIIHKQISSETTLPIGTNLYRNDVCRVLYKKF